jgi:hypothetical protein
MAGSVPRPPPSIRLAWSGWSTDAMTSETHGRFKRWFWRPPRPHGEVIADRQVSNLELLYDLVYVALIGQAAHHLAEHVTFRGLAEFAVVFTLIWIAWINGSLYLELHGRQDGPAASSLPRGHPGPAGGVHRRRRGRRRLGLRGRLRDLPGRPDLALVQCVASGPSGPLRVPGPRGGLCSRHGRVSGGDPGQRPAPGRPTARGVGRPRGRLDRRHRAGRPELPRRPGPDPHRLAGRAVRAIHHHRPRRAGDWCRGRPVGGRA